MSLTFERLSRPRFLFANEKRSSSPFQGLRTHGPFARQECPVEPRILFVYPTELRESARKLYFCLKNGIGPFRGTESLLGFRLQAKNVERLTDFTVSGLSDHDAAEVFHQAVKAFLETEQLPAGSR